MSELLSIEQAYPKFPMAYINHAQIFFTCQGDKQLVRTVTLKPRLKRQQLPGACSSCGEYQSNIGHGKKCNIAKGFVLSQPMPFGRTQHKVKSKGGRKN